MDHIYTLTAVFIESKTRPASYWRKPRDSRTWGWFKTKEEAIESAKSSAGFYCEDLYYTHVVIEKVGHTCLRYDYKPTWMEFYKLDDPLQGTYTDEKGIEQKYPIEYSAKIMDKGPEGTSNVVGWSMG